MKPQSQLERFGFPRAAAVLVVAIAVVLTVSQSLIAKPMRHASDLRDLTRLAQMMPDVVTRIEEGDAALKKNEPQRAVELFKQAVARAPGSGLANRRLCEALLLVGKRGEALEVCNKTLHFNGTPMTMRATVAALMATPQPTSDEFAAALYYAQAAVEKASDQPWGYAARCDIAYRIGDPAMLQKCKIDLVAVAPGHYETKRVEGWSAGEPSFGARVAWLATGFAFMATLIHAAWHAVRSSRRTLERGAAPVASLLLGISLFAAPARAQDASQVPPGEPANEQVIDGKRVVEGGGLSKWHVDRENPVASVPSPEDRDKNPIEYGYFVMDLADLASQAQKKGDFAAAAKYWEASTKAVPDVASGYRRACDNYEKAGNVERATAFCRQALAINGSITNDYVHYARLVCQQPAPLRKEQIEDLEEMVKHLREQPGPASASASAMIECELGARQENQKRLESCTEVLAKEAPSDPATITFQWLLALMRGEVDRAQTFVVAAKKTTMSPEAIQKMEKVMSLEASLPRRMQRHWFLWSLVGALIGGGLFILLRGTLKNRQSVAA